jgi:hypothetical protein
MIRLFFYVEGQTEQAYVDRVLKDHLARFEVMVERAIRVSTGKKHGVVYRGGGRHYAPMKKDLHNLLRQHKGEDVRFTTILDLYKLYVDFPGTEEANKLRHVPYDRVKKLENAFAVDVSDPRLIPHIQLFEFETILFCEPDAFAFYYENREKNIGELKKIAESVKTPELINDGEQSAPSKRIARFFPDYPDAKPDAPAVISEGISLEVVRKKCPHFNQWLGTLESLPQAVNKRLEESPGMN